MSDRTYRLKDGQMGTFEEHMAEVDALLVECADLLGDPKPTHKSTNLDAMEMSWVESDKDDGCEVYNHDDWEGDVDLGDFLKHADVSKLDSKEPAQQTKESQKRKGGTPPALGDEEKMPKFSTRLLRVYQRTPFQGANLCIGNKPFGNIVPHERRAVPGEIPLDTLISTMRRVVSLARSEPHLHRKPMGRDTRSLTGILAENNRELVTVPHDGSCMFHTLAAQLNLFGSKYGDFYDAGRVRSEIMVHMYIHKSDDFIPEDETWDEYLTRMSCPGQWGDHPCLAAATQLYNINIKMWSLLDPRYQYKMIPEAPIPGAMGTIEIAYLVPYHYQPVVLKNRLC